MPDDVINPVVEPTAPGAAEAPVGTEPVSTPAPSPEPVDEELDALAGELAAAETPEAKKTIQGKINKRFAAITRRHAEELETAKLRAKVELYESTPAAAAPAPVTEVKEEKFVPPPKPKREDYLDSDGDPDPEAYAIALGEYGAKVVILENEHNNKVAEAKRTQNEVVQKGQAFVNKVEGLYPDYRVVARNAPPPSDMVAAAILRVDETNPGTDIAAKVAYHLAKNPEEMRAINSLDPMAAVIKIGQIAAKVSAPGPAQKTVSSAPTPTEPVSTTETETFNPYDPNVPMDVYARHHPLFGK